MLGAVGIELKAALKTRKLLVPLNAKNAKNTGFTQVRYTAGTRGHNRWGEPISRILRTNFLSPGSSVSC